jgi:hypothetical protein
MGTEKRGMEEEGKEGEICPKGRSGAKGLFERPSSLSSLDEPFRPTNKAGNGGRHLLLGDAAHVDESQMCRSFHSEEVAIPQSHGEVETGCEIRLVTSTAL